MAYGREYFFTDRGVVSVIPVRSRKWVGLISKECPEMLLSSDPSCDPANSAKISHYFVLNIQLILAQYFFIIDILFF